MTGSSWPSWRPTHPSWRSNRGRKAQPAGPRTPTCTQEMATAHTRLRPAAGLGAVTGLQREKEREPWDRGPRRRGWGWVCCMQRCGDDVSGSSEPFWALHPVGQTPLLPYPSGKKGRIRPHRGAMACVCSEALTWTAQQPQDLLARRGGVGSTGRQGGACPGLARSCRGPNFPGAVSTIAHPDRVLQSSVRPLLQ